MTIKNFNDLYWKLFNIAGGGAEADVTKVLDSIVKSDRSKLDQYFSSAIDQIAFDTEDWKRLREFLIDLFTAHRSLITQSAALSDPHFLSNSELDELFRSFGFEESVILKGFDENPLENKVQLFLDLVNLYKIKGTPRSILEVLQYYGIPELDIFEFWLQKSSPTALEFKGEVIAGTTINPSPVTLSYDFLTFSDPHWMMSESQILQLDSINKINLPSKSPYFAVQPTVEVGIENAILVRLVQDQYTGWESTGDLPDQNADITILGITSSLLELYLLTLYSFQKEYQIGTNIDNFSCYDGTNTSAVDIIDEYNQIISTPITRDNKSIKWQAYLDLFTRPRDEHFLYNKGDNAATTILNLINPLLIPEIESLSATNNVVLQSLLKDLAVWVRNNVGFGFVNLGYIFFGLNELFKDLKPVINFFKPYRARLIVLELLKFRNILTESIRMEDEIRGFTMDYDFHDYMTADGSPCCTEDTDATAYICIDTTAGTYYSRDTYDCGSYHDTGAVDDITPVEIIIEQNLCDTFRCPAGCLPTDTTSTPVASYQSVCDRLTALPPNFDGTSATLIAPDSTDCTEWIPMTCENVPVVFSEVLTDTIEHVEDLYIGSESVTVLFPEAESSADYVLNINIFNEWTGSSPSMYGMIITNKSINGFTVNFSSPLDSIHYKLSWSVDSDSTDRGIDDLTSGSDTYKVTFTIPLSSSDYSIGTSMFNNIDTPPSMYQFIVTDRDTTGFTMQFNSPIDSTNYSVDWSVYDTTASDVSALYNIPNGVDWTTVDIPEQLNDIYSLSLTMINTVDVNPSIYSYVTIQKNTNNFTVKFSSPIDSTNYYLAWAITYKPAEEYHVQQESGFRLYDTMGTYDCTHGFDMVDISMEVFSQLGVLLQENDYWLLQDGGDSDGYAILV